MEIDFEKYVEDVKFNIYNKFVYHKLKPGEEGFCYHKKYVQNPIYTKDQEVYDKYQKSDFVKNLLYFAVLTTHPDGIKAHKCFFYKKRKEYRNRDVLPQKYIADYDLMADVDYIFKKYGITLKNKWDIVSPIKDNFGGYSSNNSWVHSSGYIEHGVYLFINTFGIDEILQKRFNPEQKPISTIQIIKDNFEPLEAEYLTKLMYIPLMYKTNDSDYKEQMLLDNPIYMYNWGNEGHN